MSEYNNDHKHEHAHAHAHHHDVTKMSKGRLSFVILFNLIITIAEILGGLISGSLSLISDASHNASDIIAITLSYASIIISNKPRTKENTFGFKRANILAAFINSAALLGISTFLSVEAVRNFINPKPIQGTIVIIVALIGLFGNLFSMLLLKSGAKENINVKSSYLHLLGDTLSSVVVVVSGVIIKYFNIYWVDPIFTIIINIMIIRSSYSILKESINILMQGTPVSIDIDEIVKALTEISEIKDLHHIHVWSLDEKNTILEAHVGVEDMPISKSQSIYIQIEHKLREHYNINHCVIQFESTECQGEDCNI